MIKIIILIVILFCFIIISYKRQHILLISPANITSFVFLCSLFCYMFEYRKWGYDFYTGTFILLLMFFIVIWIIDVFFFSFRFKERYIKREERKNVLCARNSRIKYFDISSIIVIGSIFLSLILTLLYSYEVIKIGTSHGVTVLSSFGYVKDNYSTLSGEFNAVIRQGYKIVIALAYVSSFFFVNNFVLQRRKKLKDLLFVIPVIMGISINIVSGSRGDILKIIGLCLFFYIFLHKSSYKQGEKFRIKQLAIVTSIFVAFFCLFFISRSAIKQVGTLSNDLNMFDYLFYYFGGPIQVLNLKVHIGITQWSANYPGYFTFSSLYSLLGIGVKTPYQYLYLDKGFLFGGNVGTILASTFIDFGYYFGGIWLIGLYFAMTAFFYSLIRRNNYSIMKVMMYGLLLQIPLFSSYDSLIYQFLSASFAIELCLVYIFQKIYIDDSFGHINKK